MKRVQFFMLHSVHCHLLHLL